jgi:hypothetical protein
VPVRYLAFVYRDGWDDSRPFDSDYLGLFATEAAAVAAAEARLAELPEDELDEDGTVFFSWRGLVERGELGRVSATEWDEHGEALLLEAFPDLGWGDEHPSGVKWWVDREYQVNQPYLAR